MNLHFRCAGCVHGHTADSPDIGEGEYVRNGVLVVPDLTQIGEVTYHVGVLMPAISESSKRVRAASDVGKHCGVFENRDGGLGVQKDPVWVNARVLRLC